MNKVQIQLYGKTALVDEDQVKLLKRKESLIGETILLCERFDVNKSTPQEIIDKNDELDILNLKLKNLNHRIRKNVQYI